MATLSGYALIGHRVIVMLIAHSRDCDRPFQVIDHGFPRIVIMLRMGFGYRASTLWRTLTI